MMEIQIKQESKWVIASIALCKKIMISFLVFSSTLLLLACHKMKDSNYGLYEVMANTTIITNVPYVTHDSISVLLDVYLPVGGLGEPPWLKIPDKPSPTLLYFHGGGWSQGDRSSRCMLLLPYLQKGWNVVSVDYKFAEANGVQDCIEDSRKALEWTYANASHYGFDTTRIFLSGESAGGHLAMLVGTTVNKSLSKNIRGIINWYGITDLEKAVTFWNDSTFANVIYGNNRDRKKMNEEWSPIHHLDTDTPPIITIHGGSDINVPIDQAELLHDELNRLHLENKLVRLEGKKHGNFSELDYANAFKSIWEFIHFDR